ncbi:hypothetical protein LHA31_02725 [Carnobacterium viridans]|uniref:Uncharacterized protein n=1 Tax=Carnobacterium viridans TaxID=174587 RepID=A0A1H1BNS8_9LACT|nr:hypothetical protein [Carnobacterium viridans]UDE95709.1 hypothetical protein LHA31_02725 [Carnobacterium viridans]SDQ53655.1 hypothetical protein SAMN04487752_2672 [Carnobacterium viridans]SDQ55146.1 hypothetical protein SAMN04487752_2732 [Carnobacterium viridans]
MYPTRRFVIKIGGSFVTEIEVIGFTRKGNEFIGTYKHKVSQNTAKIFKANGESTYSEVKSIADGVNGVLIEL